MVPEFNMTVSQYEQSHTAARFGESFNHSLINFFTKRKQTVDQIFPRQQTSKSPDALNLTKLQSDLYEKLLH